MASEKSSDYWQPAGFLKVKEDEVSMAAIKGVDAEKLFEIDETDAAITMYLARTNGGAKRKILTPFLKSTRTAKDWGFETLRSSEIPTILGLPATPVSKAIDGQTYQGFQAFTLEPLEMNPELQKLTQNKGLALPTTALVVVRYNETLFAGKDPRLETVNTLGFLTVGAHTIIEPAQHERSLLVGVSA